MGMILASQSPRRRELLTREGVEFRVEVRDTDEVHDASLAPEVLCATNAAAKAEAVAREFPDEVVIGADTLVFIDGEPLGKPADEDEARRMIRNMAGKTHSVFTGVAITTKDVQHSFVAQSDVTFAELADEEIEYYVQKYRPMDKAGAYGAQEWIGYIGMSNIVGSYFNVMGLPVQRLYVELKSIP